MVDKYQAAIAAKGAEIETLKAKIKEIPLNEMMGEKAKALKDSVSEISASLNKLKDQLAVYSKELTAKQ
jgi:hypothetical protein